MGLPEWDGELTSVRHDPETGAWFVIGVHSTRLGPASGGTRAMVYPGVEDAVADARRLAGAMTLKMAAAGLPMGGGKSVIALPAPRAEIDDATWRQILEIHAANLNLLGGNYTTGPDIGTNSADMDALRTLTPHVFGRTTAAGGPGSSAPMTALGVFAAIEAGVAEAGLDGVEGLRVLVQGLGAVGADVARLAAGAGAKLIVADVDPVRRSVVADAHGAEVIGTGEVLTRECDVLVPCATGGLLTPAAAGTVPCTVIAGAANNLLTDDAAAEVLRRRGIVYAPDFVANAGGAIHLVGREVIGWSAEHVADRTRAVGDTLTEVFADARTHGISTVEAAERVAARTLSGGPLR
ncbi:Glu/Leu/Phe/Val family dehydrogenase [Pseudonocardia parietis]|uniref:Leucine dehydrogenase n=1 Tax=Pseudonocardia parietis TaxID=570936 RepID=A0ABS4VNA4_9PSEU|nr:Glu/Leu/Phe/Val dehydrogenase [Pseudonocardia parietis]MBP2365405.1 leucine dehydrogenase [Pseudonocardia parietis]